MLSKVFFPYIIFLCLFHPNFCYYQPRWKITKNKDMEAKMRPVLNTMTGKSKKIKKSKIQPREEVLGFTPKKNIFSNLFLVVPLVFLSSTAVGVTYYSISHSWELSTSLFYTIQVLLGCMYGVPYESEVPDQAFTLALNIWGSTILVSILPLLPLLCFLPS